MKTFSITLLLLSFAALSFTPVHNTKPLPLCSAIKKILADEAKAYASFKGEALDKNDDGSENFKLKIALDGWESHSYVTDDKNGGYVEIFKEHATKAKAMAQYNTTVKQLESCLAVKGETLQQEGIDKLFVIKKGKSEIAVVVTTTADKPIIILTVENAEEE